MDHNLEDSLTMEGIENMDFEHSGVDVPEEMGTENSTKTEEIMPIDMDTVHLQPTLMEGSSEEVIVSDFIGDQFGYQEFSVQTENISDANITTIDANQFNRMTTQNEQIIDMQQYIDQSKPSTSQPGLITIKTIPQHRAVTKKPTATAAFPRQVAIAPKPSNVQYAIAPKPVALVMNKTGTISKTVPMKSIVQGIKGNSVLAQIGKQLVMVPVGAAGQKLKLASIIPGTSTDASNIQLLRSSTDSAQLIANKGGKQVKTKFIIQGQTSTDPSSQPAVISKVLPGTSTASTQARYIMQQKTVPISIGGSKVLLTTPPKQAGVKVAPKKQIISIKTENSTTTSQANIQTKKILITANPSTSQLKTAAPGKVGAQAQAQVTQIHPINVPGKGIHYIKLVTNQPVKPPAQKQQTITMAGKNFVLTDNKGNLIQVSADKLLSGQPPPLLVTKNTTSAGNVLTKGRKLVRIAPISSKSDQSIVAARTQQSLLMPREPPAPSPAPALAPVVSKSILSASTVSLEEFNEMVDHSNLTIRNEEADLHDESLVQQEAVMEMHHVQEPMDIKPTLASLISDAVGDGEAEASVPDMPHMEEVEIEFENTPSKQEYYQQDENSNSMDQDHEPDTGRHENFVVVPPSIISQSTENNRSYQDETSRSMAENRAMPTTVSVEADVMPYLEADMEQTYNDTAMFEGNVDTLRPRKACNCTKSQCLKLYCDCFANGEFCNQCNCNNCHNNLRHEDTRQKAIRACLERNPNAFRPKIGKSKSGGPQIVRRHNKGCNCKRSGCLKNYCECYEAKIACTLTCKCVGCRNIEETLERRRDALRLRDKFADSSYRQLVPMGETKQPCSFLTREVIEAVAQCMLATVGEEAHTECDPVEDILLEFSRCMADIISASQHAV